VFSGPRAVVVWALFAPGIQLDGFGEIPAGLRRGGLEAAARRAALIIRPLGRLQVTDRFVGDDE
jgi:hypothetical protein